MKYFALLIFICLNCFLSIYSQTKESEVIGKSQFYIDSIFSESLGEYRKHNIYLPPGFGTYEKYKIIYATDGNEPLAKDFIKSTLDSLIGNKIIKPTIYIGSHPNNKNLVSSDMRMDGGVKLNIQYRNFEYVEEFDKGGYFKTLADRFKNHMHYFKDELIPKIEQKLGLMIGAQDRIFYGVSNGAGFGANLLNKHPDVIGTYICFSTLGSNVENNNWSKNIQYPDLYIQYGIDEGSLFKGEAEKLHTKYQESNSYCELNSFNGGHDYQHWNEEFKKTIANLLSI